jgi:hypothetical protein
MSLGFASLLTALRIMSPLNDLNTIVMENLVQILGGGYPV